jgi:hypothetical protein
MIKRELALIPLLMVAYSSMSYAAAALLVPVAGGVITQSATYYLGYDLVGTLTVDASQVTIDLNGYNIIGGISLTATTTAVEIRNGFINGNGLPGIELVAGNQDIVLQDLLILNSSTGISALGSLVDPIKRLSITNVAVIGAQVATQLEYCQAVRVKNAIFNNNALGAGLSLNFCDQIRLANCSFNNNNTVASQNGLEIQNSFAVDVVNCEARGNSGNGFSVDANSSGVIFEGCSGSGNTVYGFLVYGLATLYNCIANNNTLYGFEMLGAGVSLVQGCSASNNTGCGFDDLTGAGSGVRYANNLSFANGTDYCIAGVPVVPATAPFNYVAGFVGATYWDNVQG